MSLVSEKDKEEAQDLYREVFVVIGSINEAEKTLSRLKNEATELLEKLTPLIDRQNGNET